jgi:spore maturation protein CgeB
MKNNFIDPKVMHRSLGYYCMAHGGSKDCFGLLHKISFILYDADGNELTNEYIYTSKPHFKCKCDKCGYETILPFDPDAPTILY